MYNLKSFFSVLIICTVFFISPFGANAQNSTGEYEVRFGKRPQLDLKNIPEDTYHQGIIRIQFTRDFGRTLENIVFEVSDNDYVTTGILSLDELNRAYIVNEYIPMLGELYEISEASLQYKERHRAWGFHLWYELKLDEGADIIEAVIDFEGLDEVRIAEPAFIEKLIEPVESRPVEEKYSSGRWSPNDPLYYNQWHFHNTGQLGGMEGMDCNAEAAWEIETGNSDVIVAIIDTGMEFYHDDLEGNMWENIGPHGTGTTPGSHGTHCGGTVSAVTNNNLGVAGLAGGSGSEDGVRLMTIHALGAGSISTVAAFIYAADNGAAITSNSWSTGPGGGMPSSLADAIDYFNVNGGGDALDGGITICAAGNYNSTGLIYPAAYAGSMAVASHDRYGEKSGFSSYGAWVDIIAPGTSVLSTELNNGYSVKSGTSMATPHVSGAAALVVSHAYGALDRSELWDILINSANDDIYQYNPAYTGMLGSGRLDAYAALNILDLPFTVTFNIIDEEGNEITDATVTFDGIENPQGDYVFEDIKSGTYEYRIERTGYVTIEEEITVEEETTIEVVMEFAMFTVTFEVEDEDGNAITDAVVKLNDVEYEPGEYVIENIIFGEYYYSVVKEGYKTKVGEIAIIDEDITVQVVLEEGTTDTYPVVFKVTDVEGNTIGGAIITFDEEDYTTDANGNVYIPAVETGIYAYSVAKEGYFTFEDLLMVDSNVYKEVTLLFEAYTVTFDVVDEEGEPITNAVVTLDYVEYEPGEYVIEDVLVGEHQYSVAKEGYITKFAVVEVIDEDVLEEVTLTEGTDDHCTVTFTVADDDGIAVEDAVVTFDETDYTTDSDGQVVIENVEVGFYSYLVTKDGYLPAEDMVTVDKDVTVNVTLYAETFTVTFDVVDEEGEPITDAVITLGDITNEPGDYVFENVKEGTYNYTVEKEGYVTVEDEIYVDDDTTVEVTMIAELYTLTLLADPEEGGEVEGAGEYKADTEVTLTAIPADNWIFVNWTDDVGVVSQEAEFVYTMPDENVTLTANFEYDPALYTLTLNVEPAGSGTVDGEGEYQEGEEVTITASPEENFEFDHWSGDTEHVDNAESATTTVTMPAENITLTANFLDVSVEEIPVADIMVFPNPARDKFNVESSENIKQIRLIDISGQVILNIAPDNFRHEINVNNINPGVYFIQIQTDENVITKRVQVAR